MPSETIYVDIPDDASLRAQKSNKGESRPFLSLPRDVRRPEENFFQKLRRSFIGHRGNGNNTPTFVNFQAHRGLVPNGSENTISGFKLASENSTVKSIEFDVRMTKDKVLVVAHGLTEDESHSNEVQPDDMTYEVLHKKHPEVPRFEDVVKLCKERNLFMNIELKTFAKDNYYTWKETVDSVVKLLQREFDHNGSSSSTATPMEGKTSTTSTTSNNFAEILRISSFDGTLLQRVKEIEPKIPLGMIYEFHAGWYQEFGSAECLNDRNSIIQTATNNPLSDDVFMNPFLSLDVCGFRTAGFEEKEKLALRTNFDSVHLFAPEITLEMMTAAKTRNVPVVAYFANPWRSGFIENAESYEKISNMGASVICGNKLDEFNRAVELDGAWRFAVFVFFICVYFLVSVLHRVWGRSAGKFADKTNTSRDETVDANTGYYSAGRQEY